MGSSEDRVRIEWWKIFGAQDFCACPEPRENIAMRTFHIQFLYHRASCMYSIKIPREWTWWHLSFQDRVSVYWNAYPDFTDFTASDGNSISRVQKAYFLYKFLGLSTASHICVLDRFVCFYPLPYFLTISHQKKLRLQDPLIPEWHSCIKSTQVRKQTLLRPTNTGECLIKNPLNPLCGFKGLKTGFKRFSG